MARMIASPRLTGAPRLLRVVFAIALLALGACAQLAASAQASKGEAPKVTLQPHSIAVVAGMRASFEAAASGTPAPSVQWEVSSNSGASWTAISGATTDTFAINNAEPLESGHEFRATFKNSAGSVSSEAATLTVELPPIVLKQPASTLVEEGQNAVFEASATGVPSPTVQWESSTDGGTTWAAVAGATSPRLTVPGVVLAETGTLYRAVFTNAAGSAKSAAAALTVGQAPAVTVQPLSTTLLAGQSIVFEAAASGTPAPSVQWEISTDGGAEWSAVEGATTDQLAVGSATVAESGTQYRAVFANVGGRAISEAATLTVSATDYGIAAWGENTSGQLGDGNTTQADTPVVAGPLSFVTSVSSGLRYSLALLANGTVMAWGSNLSGQLGDGGATSSSTPVPVSELTSAKAIAAGANHSLALLDDGTVVAWGSNESGELGDGGEENSVVPVPVSGLSGVTAIAAGSEYSLALLANGTVMAWGYNEDGQLGDGKTVNSDVPVAVHGLSGVTAIAAGAAHALALHSNGTISAWGRNANGQLGNPSVTEQFEQGEEEEDFSDVPVPVVGVSGATAVAAGQRDSMALLGDGTVDAWGGDREGELGDGMFVTSDEVPTAVIGLAGVDAIAAGGEHSMALLGGGEVMTWGEGGHGELGNGTAAGPSDVPVAVKGLAQVAGLAAGGFHDLTLGEPLPSIAGVSPGDGPVAGGTSVNIAGSNLDGATSVHFGASSASSFTVNSATSITAVAPPGAAGTVDVSVTTPAGVSPLSAADHFSYLLPPTVEKLSAKGGTAAGGTHVTITGTSLQGATLVSFGSVGTSEFTVNSPTSITVVAPPATGGTVAVTVTTPFGTSATSKKAMFKFEPAVDALSPAAGSAAGGTPVVISGAGFALGATATSFKFGTKKATGVDCTSGSSCTVIAPAHTAGSAQVIATVAKAKSPANAPGDVFTYE